MAQLTSKGPAVRPLAGQQGDGQSARRGAAQNGPPASAPARQAPQPGTASQAPPQAAGPSHTSQAAGGPQDARQGEAPGAAHLHRARRLVSVMSVGTFLVSLAAVAGILYKVFSTPLPASPSPRHYAAQIILPQPGDVLGIAAIDGSVAILTRAGSDYMLHYIDPQSGDILQSAKITAGTR